MTTGNKGRRKLPAAAVAKIPATPVHTPEPMPEPMTADEAASAIEVAHDAAHMAASPLLSAGQMIPAPVAPASVAPAAPPPEVEAESGGDPVPADTATPASDEDKTMDVNATTQDNRDLGENAAEQAQAMFAEVQDRTRGAVEKGQKLLADVTEFSKGNIEALVESSKIAVRGLETMGQDAASFAKSSFEDASQAMQTLATVKSPTEFMKLQADFARSAFDAMVQQTSRRTEASLKLAGEIAQPISNRVAIAADKIKIAA